jgi:hypothetical protein
MFLGLIRGKSGEVEQYHPVKMICPLELFARVLGKTLPVDGFGRYGHLELNVLDDGSQAPDYCHHTIWIEPEFVEAEDDSTLAI